MQVTEYANAPHSFDNPLGSPTPVQSPRSQSVRNCKIVEEANGTLANAASQEPFTYRTPALRLARILATIPRRRGR